MTALMPRVKNHGIIFIVVQVIPAATMLMAADDAHVRPSREFLVSGTRRHGSAAERAGGHVTRESVADVGRHLLAAIVVGGHRHVTGPVTLVANCRLLLV